MSTEELLTDVQKSLDILASMDEARVARRCFDLIQELLEFAKSYVQQPQRHKRQDTHHVQYPLQIHVPRIETDRSVEVNQGFSSPAQSNMNDATWVMDPSISGIWANMVDPIALAGFVVGDEPIEGMLYDNSWFGPM